MIDPMTRASAVQAIVLAAFCFAATNAIAKIVVADLHPVVLFFLRNVVALVIIAAAWRAGLIAPLIVPRQKNLVVLRSILVCASLLCLFVSFRGLSVASALAIHFASLPAASIISAVLTRRGRLIPGASAVGFVGFVGVLMVIHPQAFSDPVSVGFAVASAMFACASQLMLASLSLRDDAATIAFYLCLVGVLGSAPALPFFWTLPLARDIALIVLLAGLGCVAQYMTVRAVALSSNVYVAPFQYLVVVFGLLFGTLLWREEVRPIAVLGATIITSCAIICFAVFGRRATHDPIRIDGSEPNARGI